ncbi:hypothetical protein H6G74_24830 [Nostoc spongiaeforme FACHB-130]|uniref:Uncharacterized protein n=1 Tax=Nostoc spongiaeforme FACHB-130 TaxID=1357510 RepID=A0ABR8G2S4_9NOSO|nr:hypothetical protein [Nostoc spongiaeforme]MBD2597523.1 hypothetical protein [Nostoc spongiaeforme FACHB-130]
MRELRQFTPKRRLAVFIFASLRGNCRENQYQQLDLLTIASKLQVKLYQQVELQP